MIRDLNMKTRLNVLSFRQNKGRKQPKGLFQEIGTKKKYREQKLENREQRTKNKEQRTENREQRTENREQRTENREQKTENREQRAYLKKSPSDK